MGGVLSVSDEYYNSICSKSIKVTPNALDKSTIDINYLISSEDIGKSASISCDVLVDKSTTIFLMSRAESASGSASRITTLSVPANESTHISLELNEILTGTYSIFMRISVDDGGTGYATNFKLNIL